MATQQPQQVVVMQPMGGNQMQTVPQTGGEYNQTTQPQTVVVVTTTGQQQQDDGNRYARWAYLIFAIGVFVYHFYYCWVFLVLAAFANLLPGGYGALLFFCGCVPSTICWIWLINDSTVFCSNPLPGPIRKMCCCECINGYVMAVPIAIAALLRVILWLAFFGILADALNDIDGGEVVIDNVFWLILTIGAFDVGPLILLSVDWWWYYGKFDFDALFGTKINPLRCCTGESIVVMIVCWALIAVFEEYADDVAEFIWPWILHGILSTAILIFAAFLQFSGSINGAFVSNGFFKFVCWGLGIAQGVLILIIWGYFLSWAFGWGLGAYFATIFIVYGLYYSAMTVPTVWALFSFQVAESNGV